MLSKSKVKFNEKPNLQSNVQSNTMSDRIIKLYNGGDDDWDWCW